MKAAFLWSLAAFALAYTVLAFQLDFFGPVGTLGPGFFPRVIGVALVLVFAVEGFAQWRQSLRSPPPNRRTASGDIASHASTVLRITLLAGGLALLMPLLGTVTAMALFLFASLRQLSGGRLGHHLVLAVVIPVLVFLIFDAWLKVPLPVGILGRLL